ncbi:AfsR/SARP family transcriptional regulator [Nocardia sp. NPDC003482]
MTELEMEVSVLGPLRARFDGVEATLSGSKMRSVLAILAFRAGIPVRRDELVEELGLDRSTGDPINALHANMVRLRKWLQNYSPDHEVLETIDSGYRLNIDPSKVDAHTFTVQAQDALNLVPSTPHVVSAILDDALSLWRGDALSDVFGGPLLSALTDELHQLRSAAREELVYAWSELGRNQKVVLSARRFIADDPLNERLHAALITALRRMNRVAEAVEAYKNAERTLHEELGVPPSAMLRAAIEGVGFRLPAELSGSARRG